MSSAPETIPFTDPRWTTLNDATNPAKKEGDGRTLSFPTEKGTDWWRTPEADRHSGLVYGFEIDVPHNGFEVGVKVNVQPKVQPRPHGVRDLDPRANADLVASLPRSSLFALRSDQAALFVRLDDGPLTWVKAGLELENGKLWAGVVAASPFSDWSLLPPPTQNPHFQISLQGQHLRIFLEGDMIRQVKAFGDGRAKKAFVGVMGCSPKGGGALVEFTEFTLANKARGGE